MYVCMYVLDLVGLYDAFISTFLVMDLRSYLFQKILIMTFISLTFYFTRNFFNFFHGIRNLFNFSLPLGICLTFPRR